MAASRPSWPGVHMLHRLRTRVTVFGATNENRHQTRTTTTPHPNCWHERKPVRTSANLGFSRTRSGVVTDASSSIWNMSFVHPPQASHSMSSPRLNIFDSDNPSIAPSARLSLERSAFLQRPHFYRMRFTCLPQSVQTEVATQLIE